MFFDGFDTSENSLFLTSREIILVERCHEKKLRLYDLLNYFEDFMRLRSIRVDY